MSAPPLLAVFVMLFFAATGWPGTMSCTENRCTNRLPGPPSSSPSSLLRVANRLPQPDGTIRIDKGTGIVVNVDGTDWLLTVSHIFRDGVGEITVTTLNGHSFRTSILCRNEQWDIVLLEKPNEMRVTSLTLARQLPQPGEPTVAWGFGPDGRVVGQKGSVAAYVQMKQNDFRETLQTTGRAREGDSGGPVLNNQGELIGLLWGTDGRYTYSTSSGRLADIIEKHRAAQEPTAVESEKFETTPETVPSIRFPTNILKRYGESILLKNVAAALGLGTPAGLLAYGVYRLFRTQISSRTKKKTPDMSTISLNDDYAAQLNSLYELSGHSTTADATLGRLYDIKLRDAEESSSAEISRLAKLLRKQVADQFFRIHSTNPPPAEPK